MSIYLCALKSADNVHLYAFDRGHALELKIGEPTPLNAIQHLTAGDANVHLPPLGRQDVVIFTNYLFSTVPLAGIRDEALPVFDEGRRCHIDSLTETITLGIELHDDGLLICNTNLNPAHQPLLRLCALRRLRLSTASLGIDEGLAPRAFLMTDTIRETGHPLSTLKDLFDARARQLPAATVENDRLIADELERIVRIDLNSSWHDPFIFSDDPWLQPQERWQSGSVDELAAYLRAVVYCDPLFEGHPLPISVEFNLAADQPQALPFLNAIIQHSRNAATDFRPAHERLKFVLECLLGTYKPSGSVVSPVSLGDHPSGHMPGFYRRSRFKKSVIECAVTIREPTGHERAAAIRQYGALHQLIAANPIFETDPWFGRRTVIEPANVTPLAEAFLAVGGRG